MFFAVSAYAASSVYIPGVPAANSSAIGISCCYGATCLGAGTVYCMNQSPGPIVTCSAGVCTSSAGYKNRLIFTTGSYSWTIPTGTSQAKVIVIGPGGTSAAATGGGAGGGYAEKTFTGLSGNSVTVMVTAGGSGSATSVLLAGVTVSAAAGGNGTSTGATGGCGSGGTINTCGGNAGGGIYSGAGAGGPYANGGYPNAAELGGGGFGNGITGGPLFSGQYGGYAFGLRPASATNPLGMSNNLFWDTRDIQGNGGVVNIQATSGSGTYAYIIGADGGLGGGGSTGFEGGSSNYRGYGGNGGFGGGGGCSGSIADEWGGNGGIGGGGGYGTNNDGVNYGVGGAGIAIIYW